MTDPFKHHLRIKKPCSNCPFLKEGAIKLRPGRLEDIIDGLIKNDQSTFPCHKTTHSVRGGDWTDEGKYEPSGHEAMCAGAAAYLLKQHRPTVAMRVAFAMSIADPSDWDEAKAVTIDE